MLSEPPDAVHVIALNVAKGNYDYPITEEEEEQEQSIVYHNFHEYESHQNKWDTLWQGQEIVIQKVTEQKSDEDVTNRATFVPISKSTDILQTPTPPNPTLMIPPTKKITSWLVPVDIEEVRRKDERRSKEEQKQQENVRKQKQLHRNVIDQEQYKEDQDFDRHIVKPPQYIAAEKKHNQKQHMVQNGSLDKQKHHELLKETDETYYEYEQYQDDFFHTIIIIRERGHETEITSSNTIIIIRDRGHEIEINGGMESHCLNIWSNARELIV